MLCTENFWMRHHVEFSQIRSPLCKHILCNVAYPYIGAMYKLAIK